MYIAKKLRGQSVSAYLIYMYQVEDLIRAYGLDAERIAAEYLPRFGYDEAQMKEAEEVKQGKRDAITTDPRIYTNIGDERTQRASMILKNVRYGVEFHVELTGLRCEREQEECDPLKKHQAEFIRRCRKGQYFRQPCLGCAEFPAEVFLTDSFHLNEVCEENKGRHDLGYMLYRVCFRDGGYLFRR